MLLFSKVIDSKSRRNIFAFRKGAFIELAWWAEKQARSHKQRLLYWKDRHCTNQVLLKLSKFDTWLKVWRINISWRLGQLWKKAQLSEHILYVRVSKHRIFTTLRKCTNLSMQVYMLIWCFAEHITKTCQYNFDPLKLYFYIVKMGFTGVYIIFLLSA